jgi:hypothetical protein
LARLAGCSPRRGIRGPAYLSPLNPAELRQRAIKLKADLWSDDAEDRRGAAELLAALADYDPAPLRRALLGEAGSRLSTGWTKSPFEKLGASRESETPRVDDWVGWRRVHVVPTVRIGLVR